MDVLTDVCVRFYALFHESAGINHRAARTSAEHLPDGAEGVSRQLSRKIHGNLARETIKIKAKRVVKFRVAKAAKDAILGTK